MGEYSAQELFTLLNQQDECDWVEAKGGHESSHSVMETVCAFANEPSLRGGYILLGVAEDKSTLFPQYRTVHIENPDAAQKDFVSQCSSMFNIPIRACLSAPPQDLSTPVPDINEPPLLSVELRNQIAGLKQREHDSEKVRDIIKQICAHNYVKAIHIAELLNKGEDYLKRKFLSPMVQDGELQYLYPDMINHPNQAYASKSVKKK